MAAYFFVKYTERNKPKTPYNIKMSGCIKKRVRPTIIKIPAI